MSGRESGMPPRPEVVAPEKHTRTCEIIDVMSRLTSCLSPLADTAYREEVTLSGTDRSRVREALRGESQMQRVFRISEAMLRPDGYFDGPAFLRVVRVFREAVDAANEGETQEEYVPLKIAKCVVSFAKGRVYWVPEIGHDELELDIFVPPHEQELVGTLTTEQYRDLESFVRSLDEPDQTPSFFFLEGRYKEEALATYHEYVSRMAERIHERFLRSSETLDPSEIGFLLRDFFARKDGMGGVDGPGGPLSASDVSRLADELRGILSEGEAFDRDSTTVPIIRAYVDSRLLPEAERTQGELEGNRARARISLDRLERYVEALAEASVVMDPSEFRELRRLAVNLVGGEFVWRDLPHMRLALALYRRLANMEPMIEETYGAAALNRHDSPWADMDDSLTRDYRRAERILREGRLQELSASLERQISRFTYSTVSWFIPTALRTELEDVFRGTHFNDRLLWMGDNVIRYVGQVSAAGVMETLRFVETCLSESGSTGSVEASVGTKVADSILFLYINTLRRVCNMSGTRLTDFQTIRPLITPRLDDLFPNSLVGRLTGQGYKDLWDNLQKYGQSTRKLLSGFENEFDRKIDELGKLLLAKMPEHLRPSTASTDVPAPKPAGLRPPPAPEWLARAPSVFRQLDNFFGPPSPTPVPSVESLKSSLPEQPPRVAVPALVPRAARREPRKETAAPPSRRELMARLSDPASIGALVNAIEGNPAAYVADLKDSAVRAMAERRLVELVEMGTFASLVHRARTLLGEGWDQNEVVRNAVFARTKLEAAVESGKKSWPRDVKKRLIHKQSQRNELRIVFGLPPEG